MRLVVHKLLGGKPDKSLQKLGILQAALQPLARGKHDAEVALRYPPAHDVWHVLCKRVELREIHGPLVLPVAAVRVEGEDVSKSNVPWIDVVVSRGIMGFDDHCSTASGWFRVARRTSQVGFPGLGTEREVGLPRPGSASPPSHRLNANIVETNKPCLILLAT